MTDYDLWHHGDADIADGLVDLAVNVRMAAPPPWLQRRLVDSITRLAAYPDTGDAVTAVAKRHRRKPEDVLVTAGAAQAFSLVAAAFRPRRPVVVHPQFTEPEAALLAAGQHVDRVLLSPDDGFALHPDAVPADADLVVVGNPTNPTSVLHPARTIRALRRRGRVLVVDEAFADALVGEPESIAGERLDGVLVLRSLTKTWGIAGLRAGYVLGDPELTQRLRAVQPPWSVSTPAAEAVVACCAPEALAEADRIAAQVADDRAALVDGLAALDVVVSGQPRAPFVLAHVPDGERVRLGLRARGYAVRRCDTFPGLSADWLRLAVRERAVTDGFLAVVAQVLRRR